MEYLPDRNSRYKDVDYWDERYKTEKSFEWFGHFSKFQHLLQRHVMKDDAILVLGLLDQVHLPRTEQHQVESSLFYRNVW
uniref:Uncharacterized protein n=1 Tax=Hucho hucho TaxID=62062 RepID=A0A4W5QS37_9TELE